MINATSHVGNARLKRIVNQGSFMQHPALVGLTTDRVNKYKEGND